MNDRQRVFKVVELLFVEAIVFLVRDVLFRLLPDGDHRVERPILDDRLIFRLVRVLRALLEPLALDIHLDGIADVVGVFPDKSLNGIALKEAGVLLVFGVLFQLHDDVCTGALALCGLDGIAIRTARLPHKRRVRAVFLRDDRHLVGYHECRVEADAELADDVNIVLLLHLLLEFETAGAADSAEVFLHLGLIHADAVVGDGQRAGLLVGLNANGKITAAHADLLIRQSLICQLVNGIGAV